MSAPSEETRRADPPSVVKARKAVGVLRDIARESHAIGFRQRDELVMTIHEALDEIATLRATLEERTRERDGHYNASLVYAERLKAAEATLKAPDAVPHAPGCPAIADDESDEVLYDYGECVCALGEVASLRAQLAKLTAALKKREAVFKEGWRIGYYDGGSEHDCRMFEPTAQRAWGDFKREAALTASPAAKEQK